MAVSNVFKRGQIWYWEDPVYGTKSSSSEKIVIGEGSVRYSRYVLIVQKTDMIRQNGSLLVAPISSIDHHWHDVPVIIETKTTKNVSYAKCNNITAIHQKMLKQYVCCASEETMNKVNAEIIRLLTPFITERLDNSEIKEWFGIDMDYPRSNVLIEENDLDMYVRYFLAAHVIKSGDPNDVVTVSRLKRAFDIYCINHMIPIEEDTISFLESFMRCTNSKKCGLMSWRYIDSSIIDITEFNCIRLDPGLKPSMKFEMNPKDLVPKEKKTSTASSVKDLSSDEEQESSKFVKKWSDEKKREYLKRYKEAGKTQCAIEYGVTEATALSYVTRFKRYFKELENKSNPTPEEPSEPEVIEESVEEKVEETTEESFSGEISGELALAIKKSTSRISNLITGYLKLNRSYYAAYSNIQEDMFYEKIGDTVYATFIEMLRFRRLDDGTFIIPGDIVEKFPRTLRFLDIAIRDDRIRPSQRFDTICSKVDQFYGEENGKIRIAKEYLDILDSKLAAYDIGEKHRDKIIYLIQGFVR